MERRFFTADVLAFGNIISKTRGGGRKPPFHLSHKLSVGDVEGEGAGWEGTRIGKDVVIISLMVLFAPYETIERLLHPESSRTPDKTIDMNR